MDPIIVIGAGPAGLSAAYELSHRQQAVTLLEATSELGGLARTVERNGNRFDIGGHRLYTRVPEIERLWRDLMGADMLHVRRLSRIHYRQRFFDYPLRLTNTLANLGPWESARIVASYLRARLAPRGAEVDIESWLIHRFGRRLYRAFFQTYTEKVWGMPCHKIQAEWAAQRIQDLTLISVIRDALKGGSDAKTLTRTFMYPMLGPGQLWERMADEITRQGQHVTRNAPVVRLLHDGWRVTQVISREGGVERARPAGQVISSMALGQLAKRLDPPAPAHVLDAADALKHRSFILVALLVRATNLFPDNWIYVHSPEVRAGRIQNFANWSPALVADPATSSLGLEYFCTEGDELWTMADEGLMALAERELRALGLAGAAPVMDATVVRQRAAYPVYDAAYRGHVQTLRDYLGRFGNLQTVGRNGLHRYNNLDHSMLTGLLAARNLLGEQHDVWNVNADSAYGEAGLATSTPAEPATAALAAAS